MKFSIVMVICYAVGVCQTAFDDAKYNTYNECMKAAKQVHTYLGELYPGNKNKIECMDEMEISILKNELGIE